MRRFRLILWGSVILGLGLILSSAYLRVYAQDEGDEEDTEIDIPDEGEIPSDAQQQAAEEDNEYLGSSECRDCHGDIARSHADSRHTLALQDVSEEKDLILGDFSTGEEVRTVQFPGEAAPRPFTADDVTFTLGAGRYVQRYVYQAEEGVYWVFPAQWNVVTGEWEAYHADLDWTSDPALDFMQSCAGCHTTGLDLERNRWRNDGVRCEACHGPGGNHVDAADEAGGRPDEEELAAIRGAIVRGPDLQVCGRCHSQGATPDGAHPYPIDYVPGGVLLDPAVFNLVANDDPNYWWSTGHAKASNMQYNEWLTSAHASSLETLKGSSAAQDACLPCHSGDYQWTQALIQQVEAGEREGAPPPPVTLATAQQGIGCTNCHDPHADPTVDFFLVASGDQLCTACHTATEVTEGIHHPVQQMVEGLPFVEGVEGRPSPHFAAEDGPGCITCHFTAAPMSGLALASHKLRPILPNAEESEPPNTCGQCHENLTVRDLQYLVEDTQAKVRDRLTTALARLATFEQPPPESDQFALYQRIDAALTFVQNDGSLGVHNYPYADALLSFAEKELAQLSVPNASFSPTEAPAPTATPAEGAPVTAAPAVEVSSGMEPMTLIIGALTILILLGAAFVFYRQEEA